MKPEQSRTNVERNAIFRVVLPYAAFGALWVLVSDRGIGWLLRDPALITIASTLKGWVFIAITSLLLYQLMKRRSAQAVTAPAIADSVPRLSLRLLLAVAAVTIFTAIAAVITYDVSHRQETAIGFDNAWHGGIWIALTGILALFSVVVAVILFRQHQTLSRIQREREGEVEKLRTLQLLDALVEGSNDGIFVKDTECRYLLFNRVACRRLGKTLQEVIGHDSSALFPPEEVARLADIDHQVMAENRAITQEERLTTAEGVRVMHITRGPLHDAGGKVIGLFGISRDITKRKQMDLELRAYATSLKETLSRTQLLLDSALDAVISMDQEGKVTVWNSHAEVIFGYSANQAMGRQVADLIVPPVYRERHRQGMTRFMATSETRVIGKRMEMIGMRADGSEFPIEMVIGSLRENGEFLFSAYIHDITERKRNDALLHKLSLAVEQSPESIVITNVDGEIEYVNEALTRNAGYSRDEVLGKNPRILKSGKTPPETFAQMWAALAQGQPWKGEFINRRKDGSEYVEFAIITPIRQTDGRITHYVAVKEDITEKKRIGQELDHHRHHLEILVANRTAQLEEARERAEVANLAKSAFLANMSHEIRTPMNAIVGLTHILRHGQTTHGQADKLGKIASAAEHLLSIINDMLDLSKIEAGKLILEHTDFSPAAILDHTRSLIAEQVRAKGLALRVECEKVPLWLRGDPTRLRQALLNFAGNAVKFTEKGSITLRARLLEDDGNEVLIRFEVEDTGIGIPAEKLPDLFQPFVQADDSITRQYGGTGLGLAISRRLAYLMNGDAGAESEEGRGSTFWFTVRLARGHGVVPAASTTDALDVETQLRMHHGGARLLLVEDNTVNREVALELIHAVGLNADTAENGLEAVAMTSAKSYDLILMDIQMPQMNGLDATRVIRNQPAGAATPILAMTANAFEEDRKSCMEAGMNDFIGKPVDPSMFYAALLKWLPAAAPEPAATQLATAAPAIDVEDRRQRLAGIPGLDLDRGLAMIRGNLEKYTRLLALFAASNHQYANRIMEMLAAGDLAGIKSLAHALKGSAGMLGAMPVSEAASALSSALHHEAGKEELSRLCAVLAEELSNLVKNIRQATAKPVAEADTDVDTSRFADVLARLEDLLEHGDMAASDLAKDEAALLRAALGTAATTLLARIEVFDYETAAAELRAARLLRSAC
jgi:PAS domain S-box-containing protein